MSRTTSFPLIYGNVNAINQHIGAQKMNVLNDSFGGTPTTIRFQTECEEAETRSGVKQTNPMRRRQFKAIFFHWLCLSSSSPVLTVNTFYLLTSPKHRNFNWKLISPSLSSFRKMCDNCQCHWDDQEIVCWMTWNQKKRWKKSYLFCRHRFCVDNATWKYALNDVSHIHRDVRDRS